ncbi:MAG: hypothetical protein ACP5OA_02210 [Candidatus Woesearchaeota archaeon]
MAMVGFSFTKINAERKNAGGQAINIESNAGVTNIVEMPVIDTKKTVLKFDFTFTVKYEPDAGSILLSGEVVHLYDKDFGSKVLEQWTKDKKILPEVMRDIFNTVLSRSNVEAIILSRDMGLPSPIQMPKVDIKPKDKSKVEASEAKSPKTKK